MAFAIIGIILAVLILLFTALLLVPVRLCLNFDGGGDFKVLCRFLCFTFGKEAAAQESLQNWVLSLAQKDKKDKQKPSSKKSGPISAEELFALISSFFKQLSALIKRCRVTRFHLDIICADEDAAAAALNYGKTCAIVYPAYEYVKSIINISRTGEKINIRCDFTKEKTAFCLDTVITIRTAHIFAAVLRIGKDFIGTKINA